MAVLTILFEDHTVDRFRPLAWSAPLPELRCGLFSLRERVDLARPGGGLLALRPGLGPLVLAPGWRDLGESPHAGRQLWLSGRLAPDGAMIAELLAAAETGEFALADGAGSLALACGAEAGDVVAKSWRAWSGSAPGSGSAAGELPPWSAPIPDSWTEQPIAPDLVWYRPEGSATEPPPAVAPALGWIWDIVPRTAGAIVGDAATVRGREWRRHPFGLSADPALGKPVWARPSRLEPATIQIRGAVTLRGDHELLLGPDVDLTPGAVVDTRRGPVILDREVAVGAHVYLEGPLYVGPGSVIKPGAVIHGESSFGVGNRLAGEIGESTFGDFANKQHEGFIGHAVLGSWINLGALTTCSDLKNNYGPVRVDLGWGEIETGLRFVGLLMGDHAKTAIGTLFNTGTSVGFASNIFGAGMPPKHVPNFSWGGRTDSPAYAVDKALATAAIVMARRGCVLGPDHAALFQRLASA